MQHNRTPAPYWMLSTTATCQTACWPARYLIISRLYNQYLYWQIVLRKMAKPQPMSVRISPAWRLSTHQKNWQTFGDKHAQQFLQEAVQAANRLLVTPPHSAGAVYCLGMSC